MEFKKYDIVRVKKNAVLWMTFGLEVNMSLLS